MKTKKPLLIILNGVPCAGKSTLMKTFQQLSDVPYFSLGIDTFTDHVLPPKWYWKGQPDGIIGIVHAAPGQPEELEAYYGPVAQDLITIMHMSIAAALSTGNNVILDHILFYPEWYTHLNSVAAQYNRLWVKVSLPLEELERREEIRQKAYPGCARYYYDRIHKGVAYDLEIDTGMPAPLEAAQLLFSATKKLVE